MRSDYGSASLDLDERSREETVDALEVLLELRMLPAVWDEVAAAVAALSSALDAGDTPAVVRATAKLESLSTHRVDKVGGPPDPDRGPAPEPVRDKAVVLIHSLGKSKDRSDGKGGSRDRK